ncbi:SdrD B-like domain-containing protein [Vandammella animalimorsus]|uniref:SdrD B-like domain-containing protein n=1 Tax=Vandammella animalimorsus TaxID=2029117 RepID=UPI0011811048
MEGNGNNADNGNATDPGIGGVTVTLTYTPPGGGAAVSLTKTTAADGSYAFNDLPVGATNVTITETQPANYVNIYNTPGSNGAVNGGDDAGTTNNSVITIATLPAGGSTGNNFAEQRQSTSVSGRVYVEGNGNTADDGNATDPGIGGVTVTLTYTPPGGGAPVTLTTTTGSDGSYTFTNLPVGATNVTITETQPTGYENAYNTPGNGAADGGGGTPGTTANSVITIATLPAGGSTGNNFAERGADTDLTSAIACTVSGTSATCELTCTNNGPSTALNATCGFTSALPSGVTVSCTPNSPQATLAVGESIVCKTSPFPVPSSPLDVHGGTGADNDSKGGTDPAAGNNPSRTTLGAPAPSTVPVPTLGLGGVLLLALALMVAAGLRRRVA